MAERPVAVVILAAQRAGVVNPLAARAGVSHKCLVPICGRPLIAHVLETVTAIPGVTSIRISLELEAHEEVAELLGERANRGIAIELVRSKPNIVDSVAAAAEGVSGSFIVTTADNVLLTREGFDLVRDALDDADAVLGVTTGDRVRAAHEAGQRNFYRFRDGGYANCNIYALADRKALNTAEIFREGGQFQASVGRMIRAFGLFNIIAMRLRLVTLPQGIARVGRRFGVRMKPVIFTDGALAIDVDNERTYRIAEWILGQRLGMDLRKPVIDAAS